MRCHTPPGAALAAGRGGQAVPTPPSPCRPRARTYAQLAACTASQPGTCRYDDDDDEELLRLLPFLEVLATADDVRPHIEARFGLRHLVASAPGAPLVAGERL